MTEKGKKPGTDAASQADPLSATGMFLNAFRTEPEPAVEQLRESPDKGAPKPEQRGEFTQMFHKLEPPPSPPPPQSRPASSTPQEAGDFTRMFVAAATSPGLRPAPATPAPAPLAPPSPPRMRGFSTPGTSDSASAEGSFTQLFRTPASPPQVPPAQPYTPLPSAPPQAAERAWPQSFDPAPNRDAMAQGGLSQLFRSLSEESETPAKRIEESFPGREAAPQSQPLTTNPASVTMLIQRLTEDLQELTAHPPETPPAAAPAGVSGPGEFTRIMAGGVPNRAPGVEAGVAAGNFALPAVPTLVFPSAIPAAPAPAFAAPPIPAMPPPAPAFAAPQIPAIAAPQPPPPSPPKVAASPAPPRSKLQQMLPMLLVLNAFLVVVLILLLVFALRSR
jgi:hypothetical protein